MSEEEDFNIFKARLEKGRELSAMTDEQWQKHRDGILSMHNFMMNQDPEWIAALEAARKDTEEFLEKKKQLEIWKLIK